MCTVDSRYKDTVGTENLYPCKASITIRSKDGQIKQHFGTADYYPYNESITIYSITIARVDCITNEAGLGTIVASLSPYILCYRHA
jgi:hypothetical protein